MVHSGTNENKMAIMQTYTKITSVVKNIFLLSYYKRNSEKFRTIKEIAKSFVL